jgi:heterodisulfide reductase subunit A-like polyferredoxin
LQKRVNSNTNLKIWYEDGETGEIKSLEVEFLVLSTAFVPYHGVEKLAKTLGYRATPATP